MHSPGTRRAESLRIAELVLLFIAAPTGLAMVMRPGYLFPAIWLLAAACCIVLRLDASFDRRQIWRWSAVRAALPGVLMRFAIAAPLLTTGLWLVDPPSLFRMPRESPRLWALVMVLYPLVSVAPQELAFRTFIFHRYAPFVRGRGLILLSAALFGLAHIVLRNWWAPAFCTIGGLLFGWTYSRIASLALACLEHSLYGCFIFTVGWGHWFWAGSLGHR